MFFVLVFLFLVIPIAELYVIVQVASSVGVLNTIGLLIAISIIGAWLVRAEGFAIINRVRREMSQMRVPSKEIVDGGLVLFAGALMLTPGFLTDAFGLFLLIPPTRALVRGVIMRRYKGRMQVMTPGSGFGGPGSGGPGFGGARGDQPGQPGQPGYRGSSQTGPNGEVIDVRGWDTNGPQPGGPTGPITNPPDRPQDFLDDTAL